MSGAARLEATALEGVLLVHPEHHEDDRGFLLERFDARILAGLGAERFAVLDHSRSARGVLRGLHFQWPLAQAKLVWVSRGRSWHVAVDVRRGSTSFAKWIGVELDDAVHRQLWIPPGFAHGFVALSESVDCHWLCTAPFDPDGRFSVAWDDPDIGIRWPVESPLLSPRDAAAPRLDRAPVLPGGEPTPTGGAA